MTRSTQRVVAVLAATAAVAAIGAGQASASNYKGPTSNYKTAVRAAARTPVGGQITPMYNGHLFANRSSSSHFMFVSTNNSTATDYRVYPGQSHSGDWIYIPGGYHATVRNQHLRISDTVTDVRGWYYTGSYLPSDVQVFTG